jgi:predicted metal-dependent hydrolase
MSSDPRLAEFIRLFNDREFFRAHEVLEELWLETHGKLRDFYKGLIQCACAFLHAERGNPIGAMNLYERSKFFLAQYPEECQQIRLAQLRTETDDFFSSYRIEPTTDREPPRIKNT